MIEELLYLKEGSRILSLKNLIKVVSGLC